MKRSKPHLTLSAYYKAEEYEPLCYAMEGVKDGKAFEFEYELGRKIGEGTYSTVQVARHKATNQIFACKMIDKRLSQLQRVRREIEILNSVSHQNIVHLHEAYENDRYVFLILEHAEGGELYDQVVKKKKYREKDARRIIYHLIKACGYLHSINVVHRDIKLENILLDSKRSNSNILVCDFGLAKVMDEDHTLKASDSPKRLRTGPQRFSTQKKRAMSHCGTDFYLPPEMLKGEAYSESVDMWSIGVCMYILLSGKTPFHNDQGNLYNQIQAGKYSLVGKEWDCISPSAKDLLGKLLTVNPQDRIRARDALNHKWFAKLR